MTEKLFTLREAARYLGLSLSTLRRKVLQGELEATTVPGPHGDRWMVRKADLDLILRAGPVREGEPVDELGEESAAAAGEKTVSERYEIVESIPMESVPLDVHRMALQTAHRALSELEIARSAAERYEKRFEALDGEMKGYQRALSEQAESLAEKDARVKEQAALAEENARRLAEFEAERDAMKAELRLHKERVSWLEQRVPRWVRRVFGAA